MQTSVLNMFPCLLGGNDLDSGGSIASEDVLIGTSWHGEAPENVGTDIRMKGIVRDEQRGMKVQQQRIGVLHGFKRVYADRQSSIMEGSHGCASGPLSAESNISSGPERVDDCCDHSPHEVAGLVF
jgi:hypothetical protein